MFRSRNGRLLAAVLLFYYTPYGIKNQVLFKLPSSYPLRRLLVFEVYTVFFKSRSKDFAWLLIIQFHS